MNVPYPELTGAEPCLTGDRDRFFPASPNTAGIVAKECDPCPARQACFTWAVHHTVEGVWGGSTENERRAFQCRHHIVPERIPTGPSLIPVNVLRALDRGATAADVARQYGTTVEVVEGIAARRRGA